MKKSPRAGAQTVFRSPVLVGLSILAIAVGLHCLSASIPEARPTNAGEWNLILVNGDHYIPDDFTVELADIGDGHRVDARIADALEAMLQGARDAGLRPFVCSSYRTHSYQTYLYNRKINQYLQSGSTRDEAEKQAAQWVAPPGTSEHQLGLAVDIIGVSYQILDEKQAETEVQQWMMAHCHEYGFILRYPKDKTEITGIAWEPWHYRYVGPEAAAEIAEKGICLEEYLEGIK